MNPTPEELWRTLEHLIDQWTTLGGMQTQWNILNFVKENSSNDEYLNFAYQKIMECWRWGVAADPAKRYATLWHMLLEERNRYKPKSMPHREYLLPWLREQWESLLESRFSLRRSNFKSEEKFDCVMGFRDSLSHQFILCIGTISTPVALRHLEEMVLVGLPYDVKQLEEYIPELKTRISKHQTPNN
ncbi:MAG TPA: hypothetical protein VK742_12500 [Candidatus Sulfotelmatobacter sp.]|jgi:hypothetical protein|nr:hypothetical protein [Candidatus Sulfotelmatobacter sp.]